MPLCLQPSSERVQRILWDPRASNQVAEALERLRTLTEKGFRITSGSLSTGEVALTPPPRDLHQGLMRVMSQNGDDRIVWDRRIAAQVREAYDAFKCLIAKGYRAYAILDDGNRGHELFDFDPTIEECLLVPTGKLVPG